MRFKSMLAIVIGVVALGICAWRVTYGDTTGAVVLGLVGVFLVIRGLTNTVRRGL